MSGDSHKGGNLSDMAVAGTSIPGDAGKQNIIPSVARPDQALDNVLNTTGVIGASDPQTAADNPADIPRGANDAGFTGEVITGIGDQLPARVESKNLHFSPNNPLAKGHARSEKHAATKRNDHDTLPEDDTKKDAAPGDQNNGEK